ncbi:MAG: Urease accessory protein UreE [Alphaproteobacteria bacterium]|nr:Urease accessory protein UreE [Alphaproteobacteria bacterium]
MRALAVDPAGAWDLARRRGCVTLASDARHRRRIAMRTDDGVDFLLDLVHAAHLRAGDGLALEDGSYVEVRAADEAVMDIACDDPAHLARVAWHVGNRHLPVQILANGALRLLDDHVIAEMAEKLGARVERKQGPFDPEPGAYAGGGHAH